MQHSKTKPSRYAWLVFALSAAFVFYKYILQVSPSVMTDDLMRAFHLNGTGLGVLVGFYFYTYMIMQIPSGVLLDKYGSHKLTSLSLMICAVGAIVLSQTNHLAIACLARLMMGFGAAFATTSYMKLASQWFPARYFALFAGLFGSACMSGAGTAEAPMAFLVNAVGWRYSLLLAAMVGIVLALVFYIIANPKHQNKASGVISTEPFRWRYLTELIKNKSNLALLWYGGLAFTPITVFGGLWGVPFLMSAYSMNKTAAATSISLIFIGHAIGGICMGLIGKRSKRLVPLMMTTTTLTTIFLTLVIYTPHLPIWLLNSLIALFGFFSSGFLMSYTVVKNINPSVLVATVIGVFNMGDPLCGVIADPLVGKILDLNWHGTTLHHVHIFSPHAYHLALSPIILYLVLAVICCAFIRESSPTSQTLVRSQANRYTEHRLNS